MFRSALICGLLGLSAAAQAQSYPTPTFQSVITPADPRFYGAKCDGVTDDTTALQAWAAATTDRAHLVVSGVCVFKAQIVFPPLVYGVTIDGNGHPGKLLYAGTSTTLDPIIKIGQHLSVTGCSVQGWAIRGLHFMSSTVMTAGDGLLISDACNMQIEDLTLGGNLNNDGNSNFFNAIHYDGGNSVYTRGYGFRGSNVALTVNGQVASPFYQFIDPMFMNGYVAHSRIGVHICGGVGGFGGDSTDVLQNGTNVLIDRACTGTKNTQVMFGQHFMSDVTDPVAFPSEPNIGVHVSDPGGNGTYILYRGWLASATNQCFAIDSTAAPDAGTVAGSPQAVFMGAAIGNCHSSSSTMGAAIDNQSAYWNVAVLSSNFSVSGANPTIYNSPSSPPMSIMGVRGADGGFLISGVWGGSYRDSIGRMFFSDSSTNNAAGIVFNATNNTASGASILLRGNGATTPTKYIGAKNGNLVVINDGGSAIMKLSDAGVLSQPLSFTIATLPACTAKGDMTWVSNAPAAPPYFGIPSTTGTTAAPVFCNGANWVYH